MNAKDARLMARTVNPDAYKNTNELLHIFRQIKDAAREGQRTITVNEIHPNDHFTLKILGYYFDSADGKTKVNW